jgi:hypothetical protein
MAVESNIHEPKKISDVDPRSIGERKPDDVLAIENEVKKARARRELVQETKLTEQIQTPPMAPEPPFKITGGINLGNIDYQEQQRIAREDNIRAQQQAQDRVEKAEKEAATARQSLNDANISHMRDQLGAQIEALKAAVTGGGKRDIMSELETIEGVAQRLGLQRAVANPGVADFNAQLALKRLEMEIKREDRKFNLELKRDERMWQLELRKLEQGNKEAEAKLEAEKNKLKFFADFPEQLGGMITKGIMARADNETPEPQRRVATQPTQPQQPVKVIEAYENEAGEVTCSNCGTLVGVGPTATSTACANCMTQFAIKRLPVGAT